MTGLFIGPLLPGQRRRGHGHRRKRSPEYHSYTAMMSRCHNPNQPNYRKYGAKGIAVCDRWRGNFGQFLEDMGPRPTGTTLDRIDPKGNYEPNNCRWADPKTQARGSVKVGTP